MMNQRHVAWFCCALSMLLLLCCSCSVVALPESTATDNETTKRYNDVDYEGLAVTAAETSLKDHLKNPESLQIHNIITENDGYEDDSVYFCAVEVDYSAQNGFGGYNRDTLKSYIKIVKSTGTISELDETSYINQRADAQFAERLSSVGEGIPLQHIFSEDNYSRLLPKIKESGEISSTFTYSSGDKEVRYISNLGNLEGTVTFYFCAKSEKIYQISFYWSDGQSFYDGTNAYTLGSGHIATIEDVDTLREKIDDTLKIPHGDIKETVETYFHDYECRWHLADGIYVELSWTVHDEDNVIGHIQLLLCNEKNETVG